MGSEPRTNSSSNGREGQVRIVLTRKWRRIHTSIPSSRQMRKFKLPESYLWMIIRVSRHLFIILLYLQPCLSLSPFLCSCVDVLRLPWQMTTNLGAAKTKTSSLTALEARNPKSRCWQARLPLKAPGEAASRPLPGSSHQPLEFMGS